MNRFDVKTILTRRLLETIEKLQIVVHEGRDAIWITNTEKFMQESCLNENTIFDFLMKNCRVVILLISGWNILAYEDSNTVNFIKIGWLVPNKQAILQESW